jgi:hypothetical protein
LNLLGIPSNDFKINYRNNLSSVIGIIVRELPILNFEICVSGRQSHLLILQIELIILGLNFSEKLISSILNFVSKLNNGWLQAP